MIDTVFGRTVTFDDLPDLPHRTTMRSGYAFDESPPTGVPLDAYAVMRGYPQEAWFILYALNCDVTGPLAIPEGVALTLPALSVVNDALRTGDLSRV